MSRPRPVRRLATLLAAVVLLVACGDDGSGTVSGASAGPDEVTGEVTVLAAASLTGAFTELGKGFEAANPGTRVRFSFAASSALATQVNQGAPADVFAAADTATMDKVVAPGAAGTASPPTTFATNRLEIIVGTGNPKGIRGLADLAAAGVVYVTAGEGVPIGAYARQALDKARVTLTPRSLESDVKGIVTKVTLGEADAGIVYATEVKAAGDKAEGVRIPDDTNVVSTYPIAPLKGGKNPTAAAAFVRYVTSEEGRAVLARFGFTAP